MDLDKSPLTLDIFQHYTIKKSEERIIENFPITTRLDSSHENIPKPEENFPLDIGRQIIKDTLDRDSILKVVTYHNQEYINKNIIKAIHHKNERKHYVFTIGSLIETYGVSICDLYKFCEIRTIEDLLKFNFHPRDLQINKDLFNVNHLIQFYKLNFKTMMKYDIVFNLFVLQEYNFNYDELQTISFNFEDCMNQTETIIHKIPDKNKRNKAKSSLKGVFNIILKNQLTYPQMENLGLTKDHLHYIGISSKK